MASVVCATRDNVNIRLFGNPVGEIMPTSRISVSVPHVVGTGHTFACQN